MKLKTKFQDEDFDLGEVVEANIYYGGSGRIKVIAEPAKGGMITFYFETLKGMNEMFEDAPEEPKYFYCICTEGSINKYEVERYETETWVKHAKSIGNCFNTREEAEKVVEKLRAWKRVKRDLVSLHWQRERDGSFSVWGEFKTGNTLRADVYLDIHSKDLDICFGGEE